MPDDRTAFEKQQHEYVLAEAALEDQGYELSLDRMSQARNMASRFASVQAAELRAAMTDAVREYIDDIGGLARVCSLDEDSQRNAIAQALECAQQARQRWLDARRSSASSTPKEAA
jgi:hypothetical protein